MRTFLVWLKFRKVCIPLGFIDASCIDLAETKAVLEYQIEPQHLLVEESERYETMSDQSILGN